MSVIGTNIEEAAAHLREGRLVAIPTETVYGLAGNAFNPEAVAGIFAAKQRPAFDPLICHVASMEQVEGLITTMPAAARTLGRAVWPGPLTMILPRGPKVPDLVTSGLDTVGVRIPRHPMTLALLQELDFPLAAPSANPFGYVSPTSAAHVERFLGDKLAYILDGGEAQVGIESTIVGFEEGGLIVYRMGGMSIEQLREMSGTDAIRVMAHSSSNPKAPGMLKSHYAPRIPFVLGDIPALAAAHAGKSLALLSFEQNYPDISAAHRIVLSPGGRLEEAARRLFAALRELDDSGVDFILAEEVPDEGLGKAINDRLRRAAAR